VSSQIRVAAKVLGATLLLSLTAFCGFGFLASYEFQFPNVWQFLYCAMGVAAVMAAVWMVFPGLKRLMTGTADPKPTNYRRLFRPAAIFGIFSIIALMTGHLVHLWLASV
jgi:hypothetical protein